MEQCFPLKFWRITTEIVVVDAAIELQVEEDSREGEKEKGIDVNTTLTVFESTPFIFLLIYLMVLIKLDHGGSVLY